MTILCTGECMADIIAPGICGHGNIKTGIALALFDGLEEHPSRTHPLLDDTIMPLLDAPGTAESQVLKHTEKVAERNVTITGTSPHHSSASHTTAPIHLADSIEALDICLQQQC